MLAFNRLQVVNVDKINISVKFSSVQLLNDRKICLNHFFSQQKIFCIDYLFEVTWISNMRDMRCENGIHCNFLRNKFLFFSERQTKLDQNLFKKELLPLIIRFPLNSSQWVDPFLFYLCFFLFTHTLFVLSQCVKMLENKFFF